MDIVLWESHFGLRTTGITNSLIDELLKFTERPEVLSFAGDLRAVEYVPVARLQDAFFTIPNPPPTARLHFSCMDEPRLIEGIRRRSEAVMGSLIRRHACQPEKHRSWTG